MQHVSIHNKFILQTEFRIFIAYSLKILICFLKKLDLYFMEEQYSIYRITILYFINIQNDWFLTYVFFIYYILFLNKIYEEL